MGIDKGAACWVTLTLERNKTETRARNIMLSIQDLGEFSTMRKRVETLNSKRIRLFWSQLREGILRKR